MADQPIPSLRRVAQLKGFDRAFAQAPLAAQVIQRLASLRLFEVGAEKTAGQRQHPMQLIPAGELLLEPLLLLDIERFHRQRVAPGQLHHHVAEALALQLHQELETVAASATGEAVIELLGRRHRHRRRFVVVEGAEANKFAPLLLEHHVLTHHIHDVGPFLDRLDRAWMQAGNTHTRAAGTCILAAAAPSGTVQPGEKRSAPPWGSRNIQVPSAPGWNTALR